MLNLIKQNKKYPKAISFKPTIPKQFEKKEKKITDLETEPVLPFGSFIQQCFNIFSGELNIAALRTRVTRRSAIGSQVGSPIYHCIGWPEPPIIRRTHHFFHTQRLQLFTPTSSTTLDFSKMEQFSRTNSLTQFKTGKTHKKN